MTKLHSRLQSDSEKKAGANGFKMLPVSESTLAVRAFYSRVSTSNYPSNQRLPQGPHYGLFILIQLFVFFTACGSKT